MGNVLYCWDTAKIVHTAKELSNHFTINIESRPKINNRRKYPRLDVSNTCTITPADGTTVIEGKLDNLSANGFAFLTHDNYFATHKGAVITMKSTTSTCPSTMSWRVASSVAPITKDSTS